jgi:hypothetical protein
MIYLIVLKAAPYAPPIISTYQLAAGAALSV